MKNKSIIISGIFSFFFLFSCADEHEADDHEAPVITLDNPVSGSMFMNNDTVFIQGLVTENDDLHEMLVTIRNADHTALFSDAPVVHGLDSFVLDYAWPVSGITANTDAQVVVIVSDHHENVDSVVVDVMLMP